jgi:nucleoside-diphosphate-sugar epimerase
VYASICQETGRKFQWPGSQAQWQGISDVTDARQLAKLLVWAADTEGAHNTVFNIVNGDVFRWQWLCGRLANWVGVEAAGFDGTIRPLEAAIADDAELWREMAQRRGLAEPDLGRPIEVMTDMARSRKLGFTGYQSTEDSFFDLFAQLRAVRLVP